LTIFSIFKSYFSSAGINLAMLLSLFQEYYCSKSMISSQKAISKTLQSRVNLACELFDHSGYVLHLDFDYVSSICEKWSNDYQGKILFAFGCFGFDLLP
jgi:hypothetical protein